MLPRTWIACVALLAALPGISQAGWPFTSDDGIRRGSPEFYAARAADPPGARQHYKYGKLWPPTPRPTGPHQTFMHKFHHSHYWPYPYNCEDRRSVQAFIDVQTWNGWMESTTLYDYHFDAASNELNGAGEKHLRWILTHTPFEHRTVHVASTSDGGITAARMLSVEREVAQWSEGDQPVPVLTRMATPDGRPASEVKTIFQNALENMPQPVLSTSAGDTGSTGGAQ